MKNRRIMTYQMLLGASQLLERALPKLDKQTVSYLQRIIENMEKEMDVEIDKWIEKRRENV